MAVLSSADLAKIRNYCERVFGVVNYMKFTINAALQAIEDRMISQLIGSGNNLKTIPQLVSEAIDAATAPFVFTGPQKVRLFALWAELKFQKDK